MLNITLNRLVDLLQIGNKPVIKSGNDENIVAVVECGFDDVKDRVLDYDLLSDTVDKLSFDFVGFKFEDYIDGYKTKLKVLVERVDDKSCRFGLSILSIDYMDSGSTIVLGSYSQLKDMLKHSNLKNDIKHVRMFTRS